MNIICIDIDDCLLVYDENISEKCQSERFIRNLLKIEYHIRKYDGEAFLTSSWYKLIDYYGGNLELKKDIVKLATVMGNLKHVPMVISSLKACLDGRWYGISSGDRIRDIKTLLEAGNRVVALDDYDLSEVEDPNYLYIEVNGAVSAEISNRIDNFFNRR